MELNREELKLMFDDVLNLGMEIRQNQLQGYAEMSGKDALEKYMDEKFGVIKHTRTITVTRYYTKSCDITVELPENVLANEELVAEFLDTNDSMRGLINKQLSIANGEIEREDAIYYEPI